MNALIGEKNSWPKIIHQIWFDFSLDGSGKDMGEHNKKLVTRVKEKNPKYRHYLWSEKTADFLIKKYYSDYWLFYSFLDPPIRRVDFARFFILHFYGGIYLDIDYYCMKGFDDYFRDYPQDLTKNIILHKSCYGNWVTNSILLSKKNQSFWLYCMEKVKIGELVPWWGNLQTHLETSTFAGPYFMTEVVKNWFSIKGEKDFKIISEPLFLAQNFQDCKYTFHEGHTTWINSKDFITPEFILILIIIIFVIKYRQNIFFNK